MASKPAVALAWTAAAALVLGLAPAALAGNGGVAPPDSATPSGDAINQVYWVVFAVCAVVFVVVETALLLFVFRYRRRGTMPEDAEGPQVHGNTRIEVAWTLAPALLLVGLAIFTFVKIPAVHETAAAQASDNVRVRVEAHQFYWQYVYPNEAISFDTLYLPAGRPVTLELGSLDVPHSWWVPELTGKRDAIPGQTNLLTFTPRRTGLFADGKCGEFCGIQHAFMRTRVQVLEPAEFERWLRENAPSDAEEAQVALGRAEWEAACAKCHGLEGEGDIGPPIAGNGTLVTRPGLRTLLFEGQDLDANPGYMPPVGRGWRPRQIDALIAFVQSNPKLAGGGSAGGGAG